MIEPANQVTPSAVVGLADVLLVATFGVVAIKETTNRLRRRVGV